MGIKLKNHPDPRRLVLSDDWPDDLHPLRRDMPLQTYPASDTSCAQPMNDPPKDATVVPIGPFFQVLEEPAYFRLFGDGS